MSTATPSSGPFDRGPEPPPWLAPMLEKYREMLRLRRGDQDGSIPDPRPAMAALARAFPGALREIDRIHLDELERRLAYLQGVAAHGAPADPPPWAPLGFRYHALLRGLLAAKGWLARRRTVDEALRGAFREEILALPYGQDALLWAPELERLAVPPGGRVASLALERLARESGLSEGELRRVLFG